MAASEQSWRFPTAVLRRPSTQAACQPRLSSAMDRFDLVVIGAGAAGEAAAHYARSRGAHRSAIIDRGLFGGSCPFWACMPSKALLHAAAVHHGGGDYPWSKASDFRDYMINREGTDEPDDSGHMKSLEGAGATVIRGSASLDGPGRVRVGDRVLEAGAVVLAVGSVSRVPSDLPGLGEAHPWTNVEGTSTRELPRSLAILGAGPTGVELAQVYARYGVPVTLIHPARPGQRQGALAARRELLGDVARGRRRHAAARVARDARARRRGGRRRPRHRARRRRRSRSRATRSCSPSAATIRSTASGSRRSGSRRRTGRWSRTSGCGSPRTSTPSATSAGPEMHTHLGHYTGEAVVRIALGDDYRPFLDAIPRATYTDPETASVGLLLEQAKERGIDAAEYTRRHRHLVQGLHRRGRRATSRSSSTAPRDAGRRIHGRARGDRGDPRVRPRHPRRHPARRARGHDPRLPDRRPRPRHGVHRRGPRARDLRWPCGVRSARERLHRRDDEPPAAHAGAAARRCSSGVPESWTDTADVPDDGWRPKDVVGHLITGELTDWIERTQRILEHGTSMPFDRFDRFAHADRDTDASPRRADRALRAAAVREPGAARGADRRGGPRPARPPSDPRRGDPRELLATWAVHDLDHVSQIFAGMAGSHDAEVGPWKAYLGILLRREDPAAVAG